LPIGGKIKIIPIINKKRPGIDKDFPEKRDKNHGHDDNKGPKPPGYGTEAFHFLEGRRI
jgi:hypothetical protein